jgi:hypothetical protein
MANTDLVSTKETDYLDEDKPIRGQNYVLLSFISPEDVILNKETYYFSKFLSRFSKDMNTLFSGIQSRYPDSKDLIDTLKNNHLYVFDENELNEQYKYFKSSNSSDIESDYHRDNNFQTSIRGIKVRGTYDTAEDAKTRCEALKKHDNNFDIFIAQVGCWCPWSPNPNDLQNQEYSETQLNTLMKKYKENMESKDIMFERRKQEKLNNSKIANVDATELADSMNRLDPWTERKLNENPENNEIVN